jgi:hypothetical protein
LEEGRKIEAVQIEPATMVSAHAGHYLRRLKDIGIHPDTPEKCKKRIADAGLTNFFAQKLA